MKLPRLLRTKAMTVKAFEIRSGSRGAVLLFHASATQSRVMQIWIEAYTNAFARLKHYRAVAFRYNKLKRNYEAVVAMACAAQWLPM